MDRHKDTPSPHILVVDDALVTRESIAHFLTFNGYTVETATSGEEGLEKFKVGQFDVVLTDWNMPGIDGPQLVDAIKELSPGTPVVLTSAFIDLGADAELPRADRIVSKLPGEMLKALQDIASKKSHKHMK